MKKTLLIILVTTFMSCATPRVATESSTFSSEHSTNRSKSVDSVFIEKRDSIFVRVTPDTVFFNRYHTLYKYQTRVDTLVRIDTIKDIQKIVETKQIEVNRVTGWQHFQIWLGRILGIILLLIILRKIKR